MRKILLSLFSIMILALSASATGRSGDQLTPSLSVSFPGAAQRTEAAGQVNYLYITDTTAYLAQVRRHPEDGKVHDSTTLVSFYSGMSRGILRAAKGTILSVDSNLTTQGLRALQIEYVKGDKDQQPVTVCSRAILLNDEITIYSFTAPSARYDAMKKLRDQFFATLTIVKKDSLVQYRPNEHADTLAALIDTVRTPVDSTDISKAAAPTPFFESHAWSVLKMFGLLILVCALIYAFAVFTRRKG